jgi:DUF971 family protein
LRFDDLHECIWPFEFFRDLGARRLAYAKSYLRMLRGAGLSRDPGRGRSGAARVTRPAKASGK